MAKLVSDKDEEVVELADLFDLARVPHPPWLGLRPDGSKSDLKDDVWYLGDQLSGAAKSSGTLTWNLEMGDSIGLRRSRYWAGLAKTVGYFYMESDLGNKPRASSLATTGRELKRLCAWLHVERGKENISCVGPDDVDAFELFLSGQNITQSHVQTRLLSFVYLNRFKDEVGDGLSFNPYLKPGSLGAAAARIGLPDGHTETLEPKVLFKVVDTALGVIEGGDETVELFNTFLDMRSKYGKNCRSKKFKQLTGIPASDFLRRLRLTYGSALVILFALLGDRKHQVGGLKAVDVEALIQGEVSELLGNVRKTSPSLAGTKTSVPVTPSIRKALELILIFTKKTREDYNGDLVVVSLPIGNSAGNKKPQYELDSQSIYRLLGYVAREANIEPELRPHMFRRAFSMIWTWRFELGDMYWLSQLLYHSDPEYTRVYTEDEDVWKFLPEEVEGYTHDVMLRALTGEDRIVGGVSKSLRRYGNLLLSKISVLLPDQVHNFVSGFIRRHGYRIVPTVDGYCFMSEKRGARANCSIDGKWPDYSRRDEQYCTSCANYGVRLKNREHWEERLNGHIAVRDSTDIEILKAASEQGIERAKKVINWIDSGSKDAA